MLLHKQKERKKSKEKEKKRLGEDASNDECVDALQLRES
jgi:hypothetical protein